MFWRAGGKVVRSRSPIEFLAPPFYSAHVIALLDYGSGNLRSVEKALLKVGADGDVTFNKSFTQHHDVEFQEGLGFDSGWAHHI